MTEPNPVMLPEDELEEVMKDIERVVKNFSIIGTGVSGHVTSGYLVGAIEPDLSGST